MLHHDITLRPLMMEVYLNNLLPKQMPHLTLTS